ncbi:MAG: conjugal transfer protein TrbF [Planctomycetota bacterium]|nr:conjugal transfer protein TrbF [Planctomycetota bacterium]
MKLLSMFRASRKDDVVLDGNPYLNARRTMNEATGAIIASRQIWQAVALVSLLVTVGAVGGLVHIGLQSKYVPYVVEVDKLGRAVAGRVVDRAGRVDDRVVKATLASFIVDSRSVSFDRNQQNDAIWRVYSHLQSGEPATTKITVYMTDPVTSPTRKAEEYSVGVEVSSVLQQTDSTWEVNWTERVWDRKGVQVDQYRMRGLLTIYVSPPTSSTREEEIWRNPLGIFFRDVTWAKVVEQ